MRGGSGLGAGLGSGSGRDSTAGWTRTLNGGGAATGDAASGAGRTVPGWRPATCLAHTTISTIATMIHAPATTAMIHQVLSCSIPAITATAMMNPASIRNREPTTGTRGSYGCWSSCDSPDGAEPSD